MLIWGWGHRKTKEYGALQEMEICLRCNNQIKRIILVDKTYFTLFFIPLIPYKTERFLTCPICGSSHLLTAQEFDSLISRQ